MVFYQAYQDRTTQDFLQTDIAYTNIQELHVLILLPPVLSGGMSDLALDLRLQTQIENPSGFKYLQ